MTQCHNIINVLFSDDDAKSVAQMRHTCQINQDLQKTIVIFFPDTKSVAQLHVKPINKVCTRTIVEMHS